MYSRRSREVAWTPKIGTWRTGLVRGPGTACPDVIRVRYTSIVIDLDAATRA